MNVVIKDSKIHGLGVFAREKIHCDDMTYIYGQLLPLADSPPSIYGFEYDDTHWWEPYPPFKRLNHSTDPNCEVTFYDDGSACIEANRFIYEGEELTIDYGWEDFDE